MSFITDGVGAIFKAVTNGKGIGSFATTILEKANVLRILTPEEKANVQAEADKLETTLLGEDNTTIQLINQSLQTEANSEHFLVYSWRPLTAYAYILMLLINYVICPLIKFPAIVIPDQVHYTVLAILGVASYFRGQMQVQDTKNQAITPPSK